MYTVYANGYGYEADTLQRAINSGLMHQKTGGVWEISIFDYASERKVIVINIHPLDGFSATIYPALKDAIIAEQNRLTNEDMKDIAYYLEMYYHALRNEHSYHSQGLIDLARKVGGHVR